ncbi:MAG: FeoB-associated Cys-rich membrane protein [Faecalibacterium sp.]
MEPGSIIVVVIMAVGFAFAALFIAKNGGWKGEGCQGHCASCDHHCSDPALTRAKWEAEQAAQQATEQETAEQEDDTTVH